MYSYVCEYIGIIVLTSEAAKQYQAPDEVIFLKNIRLKYILKGPYIEQHKINLKNSNFFKAAIVFCFSLDFILSKWIKKSY